MADELAEAWRPPAGASMSDRLRLAARRARGEPPPARRFRPPKPALDYLRTLPSVQGAPERPLDFDAKGQT